MILLNDPKYYNIVKIWILLSIILVSLLILVGGLTRLTNSGLSITEWELFGGILPPFSLEKWNLYFNLYKLTPQFILLNSNMTLNEFKIIFYWEYFHRLLARFLGLFFLIPLLYFSFKKIFKKNFSVTLYLILALIIFQGSLGWYMVKSGLVHDVTVSHYRLSSHLFTAFIILSMLFWIYRNISNQQNIFFYKNFKKQYLISFFLFLIYLQIIFGAFVSGLDAGQIYQTWPLMNSNYFPDDIILKSINDYFDFDNQSLVQFIHRNTAYFIFFVYCVIGAKIILNKNEDLYKSYFVLTLFIFLQVILGIYTLLSGLNIYISSMHQICGIFLVISTLSFCHKYFEINR